jgi:sporulation-control protein spo0M
MSFLDKVKAAAGVGGVGLVADLNQRPSKRGDELVATVRVTGGKVAQRIAFVGINVEWDGDWEYKNAEGGTILVRGGKGYVMMDRPQNCQGIQIQPGQTIEVPVRVKIPSDAPMTGEKLKWKFYGRADVDGANDPTFDIPLDIRG